MTAIVPMKAHSERVPGKNFRMLGGKPLFRWIIDTLTESTKIDCVIVNTDSDILLKDSYLQGHPKLRLRQRAPDLCGDFVSMNKVIADDVFAHPSGAYLMTHATNPFLSLKTIEKAINAYYSGLEEGFDSLFSVNKFQTRMFNEKLEPVNHDPQALIRTQDLPVLYEENSCLYLFSKSSFEMTNARIGLKPSVIVTPKAESHDIDDPDDWRFAQLLAQVQQQSGAERMEVEHGNW